MMDTKESRERWFRDLWACAQWHKEKAIETSSPLDLVGVSASTELEMQSDEHILHKVFWWAIQEAVLLLETLETEDEEIDESSVNS